MSGDTKPHPSSQTTHASGLQWRDFVEKGWEHREHIRFGGGTLLLNILFKTSGRNGHLKQCTICTWRKLYNVAYKPHVLGTTQ